MNMNHAATAMRLGAKGNGVAQVLKTFHTAQGGKLSVARILSGEIADGTTLHGGQAQEARVAGILVYAGTAGQKITKAQAGQTVALGRLEGIETGETISAAKGEAPQLARHARSPVL